MARLDFNDARPLSAFSPEDFKAAARLTHEAFDVDHDVDDDEPPPRTGIDSNWAPRQDVADDNEAAGNGADPNPLKIDRISWNRGAS